ncbi:MAG: hypothetical protein WCC04_16545 [Terriglobales bacterium]
MHDYLKTLFWPVDWIQRRHAGVRQAECALVSCPGTTPLWQRLLRRRTGIFLHGEFYCRPQCLEAALMGRISRLRALTPPVQPSNRIPLGLLMVARGKLSHLEVRAALEAQRRAQYGSIGDWIEKLGFASERDITAALALQWGCPVASSFDHSIVDSPGNIPLRILEAFQMVPFNYTASTNTLYLAFGARVDHAAVYAIERILDCRTQPCVAPSKSVARQLEQLRQLKSSSDVEFSTRDMGEMARITSSYIARLSPEDVRISRIGQFIWLCLKAHSVSTNLLFCLQTNSPMRSARPAFPPPTR